MSWNKHKISRQTKWEVKCLKDWLEPGLGFQFKQENLIGIQQQPQETELELNWKWNSVDQFHSISRSVSEILSISPSINYLLIYLLFLYMNILLCIYMYILFLYI